MNREDSNEEYLELDVEKKDSSQKVLVKPFTLKKFEDVNQVLNALRDGYTIAVVDIKEMRKKDIIELKRAIAKIKKTTEALEGSIAGVGENLVIATPSFARIEKEELAEPAPKKPEYY
ncbi:MAG: cell division protein SepF [Nanoarchaeota archaeon]